MELWFQIAIVLNILYWTVFFYLLSRRRSPPAYIKNIEAPRKTAKRQTAFVTLKAASNAPVMRPIAHQRTSHRWTGPRSLVQPLRVMPDVRSQAERLLSMIVAWLDQAPPHNSLQRSGGGLDVIRQLECHSQCFPPAEFGR